MVREVEVSSGQSQTEAPAESNAVKRTKCPITRQQFAQSATAVKVVITIAGLDHTFHLAPRNFSTKSFGWNLNEKIQGVRIAEQDCKLQVGMNLTVVGSKELPE
jgi:hypothetical protein